jgi:hypothetical protein
VLGQPLLAFGASLVLPANSSTLTISSFLRRFTIMRAVLKFLAGAPLASTGPSGNRLASQGKLPGCQPRLGVDFVHSPLEERTRFAGEMRVIEVQIDAGLMRFV